MKGTIIGDIVGSVYEWNNIKTKHFELFDDRVFFTDDTVMTIAVAKTLMESPGLPDKQIVKRLTRNMQSYGRAYPGRGYGGNFGAWIYDDYPQPYNSYGNGAPMRASAAGWVACSVADAQHLGKLTALPTHNHPEGIKAAQCVADLIYRARHGATMDELKTVAERDYGYDIPTLTALRPTYTFDVSSQGTMPAVLAAFFESTGFEDAIRNAISLGGDSDTVAAITGGIAEAFWGVPEELWARATECMFLPLIERVDKFYAYVEGRDVNAPRQYYCGVCGESVSPGDNFCRGCGKRLAE